MDNTLCFTLSSKFSCSTLASPEVVISSRIEGLLCSILLLWCGSCVPLLILSVRQLNPFATRTVMLKHQLGCIVNVHCKLPGEGGRSLLFCHEMSSFVGEKNCYNGI